METVLIVDDETEVCELLELYLASEGYQVICVPDGERALSVVQEQHVDLILLDIRLPGMDGLELCHDLRRMTQVPILFLSGKTDEWDKIIGLSVGGDDYIGKPFSPREVVARVKAHLRRDRRYRAQSFTDGNRELNFPGLKIDPLHRKVYVDGMLIPLSPREFDLLYILAREPHRIFSADELFQRTWTSDSLGDTRTVTVHISNLRRKIEQDPRRPRYILTIRGQGYKFNQT